MKNIVYQGIPGAYSHLAAIEYFGVANDIKGVPTFRDIFTHIVSRKADFGVVPIDNSLAGSVVQNFDLLNEFDVGIVGEHFLRIHHQLLAVHINGLIGENRVKKIKRVLSHPKALEQCVRFFAKHEFIKKVMYEDTAAAARYVAEANDNATAAIASKQAADLYGLDIVLSNIEDNPKNWTRFLIIQKNAVEFNSANTVRGIYKGSVILRLMHQPGSLYNVLGIFAAKEINLSKIESRPVHGKPFEYFFYIDFEFNIDNYGLVKSALKIIKEQALSVKLLGYYLRSATAPQNSYTQTNMR